MVNVEDVDDAEYDLPTLAPVRESPPLVQKSDYKDWLMVYPAYFDQGRSHRQGRRVPLGSAVCNPLAHSIVEACKDLELMCVFEPTKTHPQDWSNPGRVRIQTLIGNKRNTLKKIATYLQMHPTTQETALQFKLPGMEDLVKQQRDLPAAPRGQHISRFLPLHSPAMSGGGVSDNIMKDMMNEMQTRR